MAFIRYIAADEADDELRALYDQYRDPRGEVDHILKIHSLDPPSMRMHFELYRHLMYGQSELSRPQREMIAVVVSALNHCHY